MGEKIEEELGEYHLGMIQRKHDLWILDLYHMVLVAFSEKVSR